MLSKKTRRTIRFLNSSTTPNRFCTRMLANQRRKIPLGVRVGAGLLLGFSEPASPTQAASRLLYSTRNFLWYSFLFLFSFFIFGFGETAKNFDRDSSMFRSANMISFQSRGVGFTCENVERILMHMLRKRVN